MSITLAFGTFSFSLARRRERPPILIRTLIFANASWAVRCRLLGGVFLYDRVGVRLMHVAAEVVVVGALAMLERSHRHRLRFAL
ncbi:MAG TPA: hypothetical protein VF239_15425 [Vicinamibacterales bacterium]